jgi:hypothetical protein
MVVCSTSEESAVGTEMGPVRGLTGVAMSTADAILSRRA